MAMSLPVVLVVMVYSATLTEVIVAEVQTILMEVLRDSGTTLKGRKLVVTQKNMKTTPVETSLPEIEGEE